MPNNLQLTMAGWNYDRLHALITGRVRPQGIDLTYLDIEPPESFFRMLHHGEFDVSEMSMGWYVRTVRSQLRPFRAIPAFPSRGFKHGSIYVNSRAGITSPSDLKGKRIGVAEYQGTSMIWIRGILADEHDVPVNSVSYHTGGVAQAGRTEVALDLPVDIVVEPIPADKTLSEMLDSGEIDAMYAGHAPRSFLAGSPNVQRLFPDYKEVEKDYYRRTGIFPIGHVVVIREDVLDAHPWVARSMFAALEESKNLMYEHMDEVAVLKYSLPWMTQEMEETVAVFGQRDWWPYGIEANDRTLRTFLRYAYEQGLAPDGLAPGEIFVGSMATTWKK